MDTYTLAMWLGGVLLGASVWRARGPGIRVPIAVVGGLLLGIPLGRIVRELGLSFTIDPYFPAPELISAFILLGAAIGGIDGIRRFGPADATGPYDWRRIAIGALHAGGAAWLTAVVAFLFLATRGLVQTAGSPEGLETVFAFAIVCFVLYILHRSMPVLAQLPRWTTHIATSPAKPFGELHGAELRRLRWIALVGVAGLGIGAYALGRPPAPSGPAVPVAAVAAGDWHVCLLTTGGEAQCAGRNSWGEVGTGGFQPRVSLTPLVDVPRFTAITASSSHSCALDAQGGAWCWGARAGGAAPEGTYDQDARAPLPRRVAEGHHFEAIHAGERFTCALDRDGRAWCWGDNMFGQLGAGTTAFRSPAPLPVAGELRFERLSAGDDHVCGLTPNREAYCWGGNRYDQLGADHDAPEARAPVSVAGDHRWIDIAAGAMHSCGITTNRWVYCWGVNAAGQLGTGDTEPRALPTRVTDARAASIVAGAQFTCTLDANGAASCWGSNREQELGDGGRRPQPEPVSVAGRTRFAALAAAGNGACGVTADGELHCWGRVGGIGSNAKPARIPVNAAATVP